jgi:hypothetical protein
VEGNRFRAFVTRLACWCWTVESVRHCLRMRYNVEIERPIIVTGRV